jgi:hypothetical protein
MGEGSVDFRVCLDVRCKDLSMLLQIPQEGIAAPASHYLYGFEGNASKEVEESGTNPDAMTLERF